MMTVNDLIQTLVDHVQAGRLSPDAAVTTPDDRDIRIVLGGNEGWRSPTPLILTDATDVDDEPHAHDCLCDDCIIVVRGCLVNRHTGKVVL